MKLNKVDICDIYINMLKCDFYMSTCSILMLTCNISMSTCKMIMLTCHVTKLTQIPRPTMAQQMLNNIFCK